MERLPFLRYRALMGMVLLGFGVFTPAPAQDPDDLQRGVARISLMNGEVSVRRGDSGDWVAGVINAPLLSDDRISTAPNSRAEVQFDAANILRIGANAEVRLTQLEAARFQMEIARGTVTFRVLRPSEANVEVDTPSVSVRPSKQGVYRISVSDSGETEVMARAGEVEVFTPRGSQWITAGQMMMARGTNADPEFQIVNALPVDDWDRWNDSRDRMMLQSTSAQYVGPGVYGAEDLDNYGSWSNVQPYGNVWHPTSVSADWAPYQDGRWVWEDWYGWTWVSADPWGWAPYHYGRWFNQPGFGWCWYPGLRSVRHYWSPALVGFFGFGGGGLGVGFGFGHVGWVPLAPYEVFHPWWGRNYYGRNGFDRNINITNVNVSNVYRNARVRNGISAVSAGDFRSGRFNNISRVSGAQVREAGLIRGQVPIAPTNANLHFSNRTVSNVPRSNENTRFFTHQQTTTTQRVPFAQQQRAFESGNRGSASQGGFNGGQPQTGRQAQPFGNRGSAMQGQQSARQNSQGGSAGGWRRFGEPGSQGAPTQNVTPRNDRGNPPGAPSGGAADSRSNRFQNIRPPGASEAPANRSGWQRFGEPGNSPRQNLNAQPRYTAPESRQSAPQNPSASPYGSPRGNGNSQRYNAPPMRQSPNFSAPRNYNPPAPRQSAPSYSAPRNAPSYSAPRSAPSYSAPRSAPSYSAPRSAPSYSAPPRSAPSYSAPRSAPSYNAPRSVPSYSAPRGGGGGGGGGRPSGGGGGGGHSSGGRGHR